MCVDNITSTTSTSELEVDVDVNSTSNITSKSPSGRCAHFFAQDAKSLRACSRLLSFQQTPSQLSQSSRPMAAVRRRIAGKQHPPQHAMVAASPVVPIEEVAKRCENEVKVEISRLKNMKRNNSGPEKKCRLCPFREFRSKDRLLKHLQEKHTKERLFHANCRNDFQWDLAVAMHNQQQELAVLSPTQDDVNLIQKGAELIRDWVAPHESTLRHLRTNNELDLALVFSYSGPKFMMKPQMTRHRRVGNVYYDHEFANLLLSLTIKHSGKLKPIMEDLRSHFVTEGSPCAELLYCQFDAFHSLVEHVLNSTEAKSMMTRLVSQATDRGEWKVLCHDGTNQVLFKIIGQVPMAQVEGESHVMHTFLGLTTALPGVSLQAKESFQCFEAGCREVLPQEARDQVEWLFSDAPSRVEGQTNLLPKLRGTAEDPMHFPFRIEECFGEKRVPLSIQIRKIQMKFSVPADGTVYHGEQPNADQCGVWDDNRRPADLDSRDWESYKLLPYKEHQEYIDDLVDLVRTFDDVMERKNKKGTLVRDLIKNAASYKHFAYLFNGCIIRNSLSAEENDMLGVGTMPNEAIHWQIKNVSREIIQEHEENVPLRMDSFCMGKMIAHNSAAYFPTTAQYKQSHVLSVALGEMKKNFFQPFGDGASPMLLTRSSTRLPAIPRDDQLIAMKKSRMKAQRKRWDKQTEINTKKGKIAKVRRQVIKRTVFTQKKSHRGHLFRKA